MPIRDVVRIDEEKCNGCGVCVPACAEGAIRIIDGKARLVADNLCDGLGACLGECPEGAITIERREADGYDEEAVEGHLSEGGGPVEHGAGGHQHGHQHGDGGCPGARVMDFGRPAPASAAETSGRSSALRQWPVQLHLLPPTAPFLRGARLVLAADCVAHAVGDFHERFLAGNALAIACPKLDSGHEVYLDKLTAMIDHGGIDTLTVLVMEVPCCSGLVTLARTAAGRARRKVPIKAIRIGLRGDVLSEDWM
jgi:NAD-dependent dihydropyrimidine dehydrogenase PreA subunit